MHHGMWVTHVPWWMSGSLSRGGGETVPGIPGGCTIRNFTYLARCLWHQKWRLIPQSQGWAMYCAYFSDIRSRYFACFRYYNSACVSGSSKIFPPTALSYMLMFTDCIGFHMSRFVVVSSNYKATVCFTLRWSRCIMLHFHAIRGMIIWFVYTQL